MSLAQIIQDYWHAALQERATRQFHQDLTKPKEPRLAQEEPCPYPYRAAVAPHAPPANSGSVSR